MTDLNPEPGSITPSTALLNKIAAANSSPRMLTPYEIELLKASKREMGERFQFLISREKTRLAANPPQTPDQSE